MRRVSTLLVGVALIATACSTDRANERADTAGLQYDVTVVAEGLLNPVGLAILPGGGLLVAEEGTGEDDTSAGVSMITAGRVDRIVSGLPSGRDSGDLSGVPLVGVSPDGSTVYTAHFGAEGLLTFPTPSLKAIDAGFVFGPADLERSMEPLNAVRLVNPFDITFAPDGRPVVTDASDNGVAIETADGRTEFIHRFGQLTDPEAASRQIDPVPTGIRRLGDEYLVTLTGGCPYPAGSGRVVAIDGNQDSRVVVDGLNMPIDVTTDAQGTIWVLEFARFDPEASCFTGEGYMSGTGRLSRLDGGRVVTVADDLSFPGAVVAADDGSLYVSEVFAGRVLRLTPATEAAADVPAPAATPWRFEDVAREVGIDFQHGAFREGLSEDPVAMMGGGVCWLDAEGDGDMDLYLVNSHAAADIGAWKEAGGLPANALYRNDSGRFTDMSAGSGADLVMRGNGCVAVDIDGDRDTDLYVTADGPNALLLNDGSGRFINRAREAGVAADGWSTAAVAGDVDGDGAVDLFVGTYIDLARKVAKPSGAFPQDFVGIPNQLYLNNGDGTFVDGAESVGLARDDRTLGAILSDLDDDGDLDLYVANDGQPNNLYQNTSAPGSVSFVDVTGEAAVGDSGSGMGVAGGDYDGDGEVDLIVTNWEAELHAIYRGEADGLRFAYSTSRIGIAGLGNGTTGWGTAWADLDNDTDLDLLIANGRVPISDLESDPELVQLFGNLTAEGQPGQLRDWTRRVGLAAVGPRLSRGAALADYDDDGDLDVAINQIAGPAVLLRNDAPSGSYVVVAADPPDAGTVATVDLSDGRTLRRELHAGSSYLASEDPRLHFGLGNAEVISLVVTWPDGASWEGREVAINNVVTVSPDA